MKNFVRITMVVFVLMAVSYAQLHNSTKTLIYTQTGKTLDRGQFSIYTDMNFYTKAGDFIGTNKPLDFSVTEYWLVAGNAVLSYGITDNIDATVGLRVYQDTHKENEYNLPDDLFLTLRAGSFGFARNQFQQAVMTSFRIPTGEEHNYPFAEYASGSLEFGLLYALSFYTDPYLPQRAFGMHFNIGWWNHNESGKTFKFSNGAEYTATRSSQDIRMALASVFPSSMFDFRIELTGILYVQKPDNFIYSAEEWAFLTPSIRYKPMAGVNFDVGVDIRLSSGDRQWTTANVPDISSAVDLPVNYPDWKVHMGANLALNFAGKGGMITSEKDYQREEAKEKIEMFEKIIEERKKSEDAQKELESLRKLRKEADKEIEDLKKILEDED